MTVGELINKLKEFNSETKIAVEYPDDSANYEEYIKGNFDVPDKINDWIIETDIVTSEQTTTDYINGDLKTIPVCMITAGARFH